jgi:DNA-binding CsgD family transcriptional regulator
MRGLKRLASARTLSAGHAFVQNLRRGHYAMTDDLPVRIGSASPSMNSRSPSDHGHASTSSAAPGIRPRNSARVTTSGALAELTAQQREIVILAGRRLTNGEIADRLYLSPCTVASHLYRSYPKLGIAGRQQLRDLIDTRTSLSAATAPDIGCIGK